MSHLQLPVVDSMLCAEGSWELFMKSGSLTLNDTYVTGTTAYLGAPGGK